MSGILNSSIWLSVKLSMHCRDTQLLLAHIHLVSVKRIKEGKDINHLSPDPQMNRRFQASLLLYDWLEYSHMAILSSKEDLEMYLFFWKVMCAGEILECYSSRKTLENRLTLLYQVPPHLMVGYGSFPAWHSVGLQMVDPIQRVSWCPPHTSFSFSRGNKNSSPRSFQ